MDKTDTRRAPGYDVPLAATRVRVQRAAVVLLTGAMFAVANVGVAFADTTDATTKAETTAALQDAAPEVLDGAADAHVNPGAATALASASDGGSVKAADDPAKGLTLDPAAGPALKVGLPGSKTAGDAVAVSSGAIAYDNGGSSSVVVANEGGATVLATIGDADAPERYRYPLDLAEGQTIRETGDGGFVVLEPDGTSVAVTVAPAWAKDANGSPVPARYELDGTAVTMVVDHRSGSYAYPVVADPRFVWAWHGWTVYLNRGETKNAVAWGSWALGFVPGGWVVKALTMAIGAPATGSAANWAVDRGWCLGIYKSHWYPTASAFPYRC